MTMIIFRENPPTGSAALNFNTTLPSKLFPFPLPIRIFFDFGTYAEAWETNPPTSRFLYIGGIQLSLLKNLLNIYAPLIYSSDFKTALGTPISEEKLRSVLISKISIIKKSFEKQPDHD